LWPFTHTVESQYSGMLEITWINGKKVLDSRNANYSFGTLQKILETGLAEIHINRVNSILVLGVGGGSVIDSLLRKFQFKGIIHGVEIDGKVLEIAEKEFNITNSEKVSLYQEDAFAFVRQSYLSYDLIIVDVFIDDQVPSQFYSSEFCLQLVRILNPQGAIIFNLGLQQNVMDKRMEVVEYFQEHPDFQLKFLEKVEGFNSVLIAECIGN